MASTPKLILVSAAVIGLVAACGPKAPQPTQSIDPGVPVFTVVQEGLTDADAEALAARFGITPALLDNGVFDYVDPGTFARVPLTAPVDAGKDEAGNPVVRQSLDAQALKY